jgi:mRNA interferase HigB
VRVIKRPTLIQFSERHAESKGPLEAWGHEAKRADWKPPADIKSRYPSACLLAGNRVAFNIMGGKYRLVVKINYPAKTVFIRFMGTHRDYDKIDAEVI